MLGIRAADKWWGYTQYARMHLECPHCQALYDIARDVGDVVFVCHQCGQEFNPQAVSFDRGDIAPVEAALAPVRNTAHIWPWLLMILIVLATTGFWVQKDAWLDNRWLRSTLINIGFDMTLRAKDWRISPASVQPKWIVRSDGSRILLVRGTIENLLNSDMSLPKINMMFFSKTEPDKKIGNAVFDITLKPSDQQMPDMILVRDSRPVAALGKRSFSIVAESVPEQTGDFTLTPVLH